MEKDFSELVEYLDEKFANIDGKLDNLQENKADKSDVNDLMTAIDAYAKKADTYFQEMVMLAHKVDRHEKWIQQIAEKLGLKLEHWFFYLFFNFETKKPIAGQFLFFKVFKKVMHFDFIWYNEFGNSFV